MKWPGSVGKSLMCSLISAFLIFAAAAPIVEARSILTFPAEIRKRNYLRVSVEACDECVTLENYYASNPVGFLLFFERALMGHHKYKQAIVEGWIETCKELRWSRVACGMVDMVSDRAYAERYIDPQTAPAHIVIHDGQPVMASKEQIQVLLAKPGHKATMMAHVMELLAKDVGTMGNISVSVQVNSKQAMQALLKRHHLVIAAFVQEDRGLADTFRAAAQEAVLAHGLETAVPSVASETASNGRKGKGASAAELDKSRIAFAACIGKGLGSTFSLPHSDSETVVAAFVNGELQPGALPMKAGAKPGDTAMLDIVKSLTGDVAREKKGRKDKKSSAEL